MTTRPIPRPAVGLRVLPRGKIFATKRQAYYSIAKAMVLERYPPGLNEERSAIPDIPDTDEFNRRAERARALFWTNDETHFDVGKWTRFIARLGKFLEFVDARRVEAQTIAYLESLPLAMLEREYQRAEHDAMALAKFADAARKILLERQTEGG